MNHEPLSREMTPAELLRQGFDAILLGERYVDDINMPRLLTDPDSGSPAIYIPGPKTRLSRSEMIPTIYALEDVYPAIDNGKKLVVTDIFDFRSDGSVWIEKKDEHGHRIPDEWMLLEEYGRELTGLMERFFPPPKEVKPGKLRRMAQTLGQLVGAAFNNDPHTLG